MRNSTQRGKALIILMLSRVVDFQFTYCYLLTCPKMPLLRQFPHKMRNESFDLAQYPVTHCLVCDVDMIERKKAKKWEAHSTDYIRMDTVVSYTT